MAPSSSFHFLWSLELLPCFSFSLCSRCGQCQTDHQTDHQAGRSDLHSVDGGMDAKSLGTDEKTQEMESRDGPLNLGQL